MRLKIVFLTLNIICFSGNLFADELCRSYYLSSSESAEIEDLLLRKNLNAQTPFAVYLNPNGRDLISYNKISGMTRRKPRTLLNLVPEGGLVLDLGGGKGIALHQMAEQKNITAIVINTQKPDGFVSNAPTLGHFVYHEGWAEKELMKFKNQADLIVDIWGAFSYSILKDKIIQETYTALKPGAKAYILFHPRKTRAIVKWQVQTVTGLEDRQARIDEFLAVTYPKIFRSWWSPSSETMEAKIIEITKPLEGPDTLDLELQLISTKEEKLKLNTFHHIELSWKRVLSERF